MSEIAKHTNTGAEVVDCLCVGTSIIVSLEAIHQAGLGLNPSNDGTFIRIPIPELTEERRLELTKVASRVAEQGKTAIRNSRRDANDSIKKLQIEKQISEDEEHRGYKEAQRLTDEYIERIDELAARKNNEILEF